jgi:hypothetical protein
MKTFLAIMLCALSASALPASGKTPICCEPQPKNICLPVFVHYWDAPPKGWEMCNGTSFQSSGFVKPMKRVTDDAETLIYCDKFREMLCKLR